MSLSSLPLELLQEILALALHIHPRPSAVLCVNRTFLGLGQPLLHAHLRFRSITHLALFAQSTATLVCAPRSLEIKLAGGEADFEVFKHLTGALRRCLQSIRVLAGPGRAGAGLATGAPLRDVDMQNDSQSHASESDAACASAGAEQVPLDVLSLQLHSHSRNPHLSYIYEALSLASPKTFVWKGPDPEHHFSTAIVPAATNHLIRAIGTWTAVEHITLTNMSFPSDELGRTFARDAPLLPPVPTLRTLHIGQATLLPPSTVAALLARPGPDALERVRLVDTYRHSIWGPRIRLGDVVDAVGELRQVVAQGEERRAAVVRRVRRIVRCEKQTRRIMGGDEGDEEGELA